MPAATQPSEDPLWMLFKVGLYPVIGGFVAVGSAIVLMWLWSAIFVRFATRRKR